MLATQTSRLQRTALCAPWFGLRGHAGRQRHDFLYAGEEAASPCRDDVFSGGPTVRGRRGARTSSVVQPDTDPEL